MIDGVTCTKNMLRKGIFLFRQRAKIEKLHSGCKFDCNF